MRSLGILLVALGVHARSLESNVAANGPFLKGRSLQGASDGCPEYDPPKEKRKVSFMLLGQQKSGTSSMWNILTKHPEIAMAGHRKENFFWATGGSLHEELRWDACFWPLEAYNQFLESDNTYKRMCPGEVLGDFTATHFSCPCCPERFRAMDPDLKLIVMLREPLSRSESRFREQQTLEHRYLDQTFASNVQEELDWMQSSHCHAYRFLHDQPALSGLPELFCSAQSNIAGWSNYPAFLRNWLKHFPPEQLLVLYTEQFDREPLLSLNAVHDFLGVNEYRYPEEVLSTTHFNTGKCGYGWNDKCGNGGGEEQQPPQEQSHQYSIAEAHSARQHHGGRIARAHPQEILEYFDAAVAGVLELASQFQIPMPPKSWLGNGRMERLNLTDTDFLRVHSKQVSVYQQRAQTRQKKFDSVGYHQGGVSHSLVELIRRADSS